MTARRRNGRILSHALSIAGGLDRTLSETNRRTRRIYAAGGAVVGWTALVLQLWIMVHAAMANGTSVTAAVVRYFSFFTILSNIAVATALTASAAASRAEDSAMGRPRTATALAVYITIVGAVYSLVLRRLWHPTGAQAVADHLLHDLMPPLYVIYWLLFVRKGELQWRDTTPWLVFPLAYVVYALVRGGATGEYPYAFIDVAVLGYARVLMNALGLTFAFLAVAIAYVAADRWRGSRRI